MDNRSLEELKQLHVKKVMALTDYVLAHNGKKDEYIIKEQAEIAEIKRLIDSIESR